MEVSGSLFPKSDRSTQERERTDGWGLSRPHLSLPRLSRE